MSVLQEHWNELSKLEKFICWHHMTHCVPLATLAEELQVNLDTVEAVKDRLLAKRRNWQEDTIWQRTYTQRYEP